MTDYLHRKQASHSCTVSWYGSKCYTVNKVWEWISHAWVPRLVTLLQQCRPNRFSERISGRWFWVEAGGGGTNAEMMIIAPSYPWTLRSCPSNTPVETPASSLIRWSVSNISSNNTRLFSTMSIAIFLMDLRCKYIAIFFSMETV